MPPFDRRTVLLSLSLAMLAGGAALGDEEIDHDAARRLLSEGKIRPLAEIVDAIKHEVPGDVIDIELELENGVYVYELKILRPDGRVQEVEADAATAQIRKIEDDD